MNNKFVIFLLILMTVGCGIKGGAVNDLANEEQKMVEKLTKRLDENKVPLMKSIKQLGIQGAQYTKEEYALDKELAKAKLLESMRSPWSSPTNDLVPTQRAVALYHLYEIEQAEQKVIEARMRERQASVQEVVEAYDKLHTLLARAAENQKLVLRHLNQPKSAKIKAFTNNFLGEVAAFRNSLKISKNPRLNRLADDVAQYEEQAINARDKAERALEIFLNVKGG